MSRQQRAKTTGRDLASEERTLNYHTQHEDEIKDIFLFPALSIIHG